MMQNPPKGYWNVHQAVRWAEVTRQDLIATAGGRRGPPFGGANSGHDAAHVVQEALECGELRAAGVRVADGVLVTLPSAAWRAQFARPDDPRTVTGYSDYWKRDTFGPPAKTRIPFAEAQAGRTIRFLRDWVTPILAQADLARWAGEEPPAEPPERPDDWPAPAESAPAAPSPPEPVISAESLPARANAGQAYSPSALAAWFLLRVKTWPKGEPPPSEADCIAAAQSYFENAPGRDVIRPIRKEKTPENWRKRGPRPRR